MANLHQQGEFMSEHYLYKVHLVNYAQALSQPSVGALTFRRMSPRLNS